MPALVEPGNGNKRPRRSSITQHLQRILHIDKQSDRKDDSGADFSNVNTTTATARPQSSHLPGVSANGTHGGNYKSFDASKNGHNRHSYSSFGSKFTGGVNTSESRHSASLQSVSLEQQQPLKAHPFSDVSSNTRGEAIVLSTWNHNVVEKKDRRATKRLEAERVELEKRLLKLEEAERTGDMSALRRESRRLTKKQPFGSSSRSSSASGDESRPSSRLSSIFSSSRRRSRSRSSSFGADDRPSAKPPVTVSKENPRDGANGNSATSKISITLPERLSTTISRELATKSRALLSSAEQQIESAQIPQSGSKTSSPLLVSSGQAPENGVNATPSQVDLLSTARKESDPESKTSSAKDASLPQVDLDRSLFAASLKPGKRNKAASSKKTADQGTPNSRQNAVKPSRDTDQNDPTSKKSLQSGSTKNLLNRTSADGIIQRHKKEFKSSPLAESQTIINDMDSPTTPEGATQLLNSRTSDAAKRSQLSDYSGKASRSHLDIANFSQPLGENIGQRGKARVNSSNSSRSFSNITSTLRFNQTAPSLLQTKSRFHNQSDTKKFVAPLSLKQPKSPVLPQKSPRRNSHTMPESDLVWDHSHRQRPSSALSGASRWQEAGSDGYNTSDEATADTSAGFATKHAFEHTRSVSVDTIPSSLRSSPAPVGSKIPIKKPAPAARDQVDKLFVICCRCKFWHDLPSEAYAKLAATDPLTVASDAELSNAWDANSFSNRFTSQENYLRTRITTDTSFSPVQCCWCNHNMSKQCCQGWSTVVHMQQRLH
ncbi:hypothetical protein P175DRAFT_0501077 [Aspergillus ochraceoroseus IBT 24754]|uniref:Uncharacterized protein n=2 Tax=Aspergillus ochraceoroseus TaxID=138278 RepID=A0A2T5M114_9EURO|nr:uncharacterized protein P175DRAFT_0501077 [Aspergillus ochraceoroseus IBT 24754]KKK19573.1 hypothetical protein AOCH_006747 [Aspergillus ochraceoroseus]PTU22220.1 hypothetical protein P175DRAFT_0501077 [Aspergillus ochraceoroseus IBT 24754]